YYYTYSSKDLLGETCPEYFEDIQKKLMGIQKEEAKSQICKVTKYNKKSEKACPTQKNEIRRKNQNGCSNHINSHKYYNTTKRNNNINKKKLIDITLTQFIRKLRQQLIKIQEAVIASKVTTTEIENL
ncbi:16653_t:CDS:2, partial [Dentiscutata heterogama]